MAIREIKFKGRRDNGEWIEGYYVVSSNKHYIIRDEKWPCLDTPLVTVGKLIEAAFVYEVDPATVEIIDPVFEDLLMTCKDLFKISCTVTDLDEVELSKIAKAKVVIATAERGQNERP